MNQLETNSQKKELKKEGLVDLARTIGTDLKTKIKEGLNSRIGIQNSVGVSVPKDTIVTRIYSEKPNFEIPLGFILYQGKYVPSFLQFEILDNYKILLKKTFQDINGNFVIVAEKVYSKVLNPNQLTFLEKKPYMMTELKVESMPSELKDEKNTTLYSTILTIFSRFTISTPSDNLSFYLPTDNDTNNIYDPKVIGCNIPFNS